MNDPVNVLILSVGTRNRIVDYFKKELGRRGTVTATDCSPLAPALYAADRGFVVPPVGAEGHLDTLLAICSECGVTCVLSLIDPEQGVLAAHRGDFMKAGAVPLVSGAEEVQRCMDKYSMYHFLERHGFSVVRRYVDRETFYRDEEAGVVHYPVMVKPRRGSASLNTGRAECREQVDLRFRLHDDLMIEEFIDGREFGVDAYVDLRS
ncbi:MAG: ATP-grasp domain-containing protein, partial [Acidobacteria bacterium]|nr:ATP-grasp domain-containing protein [Acidobacteriota bacterium]